MSVASTWKQIQHGSNCGTPHRATTPHEGSGCNCLPFQVTSCSYSEPYDGPKMRGWCAAADDTLLLSERPNSLYQRDNAQPHTACISHGALQGVHILPCPAYSSDLSPISNIQNVIGHHLQILQLPRSDYELWQMVNREFDQFLRMYCFVYRLHDGPISYWADAIPALYLISFLNKDNLLFISISLRLSSFIPFYPLILSVAFSVSRSVLFQIKLQCHCNFIQKLWYKIFPNKMSLDINVLYKW